MRPLALLPIVLLVMPGCGDKPADTAAEADADTDSDTDADTDSDTDADTDSDTDADIADPTAGLTADPACEGLSGQSISGATGYFAGDFTGDLTAESGPVTGQEYWVILANSTWVGSGGSDCRVTWTMTGTHGAPTGSCGSCDYSLSLSAELDTSLTDCPAGIYQGSESFTTTYNVKVTDGATTFSFAGSGSTLGVGQTDGSRATYLADGECLWF